MLTTLLTMFFIISSVYTVFNLSLSIGVTEERYTPVKELSLDLLEDDGKDVKLRQCFKWRNLLIVCIIALPIALALVWLLIKGHAQTNLQLLTLNMPFFTYLLTGSLICCYTDMKYAVISNYFTYGGILLGIVTNLILIFTYTTIDGIINVGSINLGMGLCILIACWILQMLIGKKIGGGDLKFIVMVSFALPVTALPYFLLLACLIMLLAFIVRAIIAYIKTKTWNIKQPLQFGIPLTISLWVHILGYIYFIHY